MLEGVDKLQKSMNTLKGDGEKGTKECIKSEEKKDITQVYKEETKRGSNYYAPQTKHIDCNYHEPITSIAKELWEKVHKMPELKFVELARENGLVDENDRLIISEELRPNLLITRLIVLMMLNIKGVMVIMNNLIKPKGPHKIKERDGYFYFRLTNIDNFLKYHFKEDHDIIKAANKSTIMAAIVKRIENNPRRNNQKINLLNVIPGNVKTYCINSMILMMNSNQLERIMEISRKNPHMDLQQYGKLVKDLTVEAPEEELPIFKADEFETMISNMIVKVVKKMVPPVVESVVANALTSIKTKPADLDIRRTMDIESWLKSQSEAGISAEITIKTTPLKASSDE